MFISVVIPALDEEKRIASCLSSLLAQDYPRERYEVIVVDNGSRDATVEIARSRGVKVFIEEKKGVARARQRGAEEARGEIIAGTDADAMPPPFWLREIAQAFGDHPDLGAVTGPILMYEGKPWERFFVKYLTNGSTRLSYLLRRGIFPGNNFAVHRDVFWKVGGFDPELFSGEDIDLAYRVSRVSKTLYHPHMMIYISARRVQEGYSKVIFRASIDYLRVVFLGLPPTGRDFPAIP